MEIKIGPIWSRANKLSFKVASQSACSKRPIVLSSEMSSEFDAAATASEQHDCSASRRHVSQASRLKEQLDGMGGAAD